MGTRKRVCVGMLVASSNKLKHIKSKRLNVRVIYSNKGLFNNVLSEKIIGYRTDLIKY